MNGLMRGTITEDQRTFLETWESVSESTFFIIRFDARGEEQMQPVAGKRQVMLTTEERIVTESRVLEERNNPFKNGAFRPVLVPDDVTTDTNPNALNDDDIFRVLQASDLAWEEYMKVVDSPDTLRRMREACEQLESVPYSRVQQLDDALRAQGPKSATQKAVEEFDSAPSGKKK